MAAIYALPFGARKSRAGKNAQFARFSSACRASVSRARSVRYAGSNGQWRATRRAAPQRRRHRPRPPPSAPRRAASRGDPADRRDRHLQHVALLVRDLDDRAGADMVVGVVIDDARGVDPVTQLCDPRLQQALVVLRRVVLEVLREVAEPTSGGDRLDRGGSARPSSSASSASSASICSLVSTSPGSFTRRRLPERVRRTRLLDRLPIRPLRILDPARGRARVVSGRRARRVAEPDSQARAQHRAAYVTCVQPSPGRRPVSRHCDQSTSGNTVSPRAPSRRTSGRDGLRRAAPRRRPAPLRRRRPRRRGRRPARGPRGHCARQPPNRRRRPSPAGGSRRPSFVPSGRPTDSYVRRPITST